MTEFSSTFVCHYYLNVQYYRKEKNKNIYSKISIDQGKSVISQLKNKYQGENRQEATEKRNQI